MSRPRILDLFSGAGGAAVGYHRAGFEVVGVDHVEQPNYPFKFWRHDALAFLRLDPPQDIASNFDAIHASPPCQYYANLSADGHWRSIPPTRELLEETGLPYVIENIADAAPDMRSPIRLCGSAFALNVRRHRLFETSFSLMAPGCAHGAQTEIRAYYGKKGWLVWTPAAANVQKRGRKPLLRGSVEQAPEDMGIDWMTSWDELREAIPPAYTEHIGSYLLQHLRHNAPAGSLTGTGLPW